MPLRSVQNDHELAPQIHRLSPDAALPGGRVELLGTRLGPLAADAAAPVALLNEEPVSLALSRAERAILQVPPDAHPGDVQVINGGQASNALPLKVGVPLIETVNPVGNPAVDADGNLFVMSSGPRGERVDVSIFRIDRDFEVRPFIRDLLNISGLAFDSRGFLYASSRAEGVVYRITPEGSIAIYAEGMGIATGLAFDDHDNLYVGDRSGTIFKLAPGRDGASETFVYATLEPSVAAYHLAFREDGTLLVTAPTTASFDCIYAVSTAGDVSVFYRGLGRPQGMALDAAGNVYVAASWEGKRGIVRVDAEGRGAELVLSGNDVVGLCFMDERFAALSTRSALFHIDMNVEGRKLA